MLEAAQQPTQLSPKQASELQREFYNLTDAALASDASERAQLRARAAEQQQQQDSGDGEPALGCTTMYT